MLADHWMRASGEASYRAIEYFDLAAQAALESHLAHEAIKFAQQELMLLEERRYEGSGVAALGTQCARVQAMLAEAYLEQGKLSEAKQSVLAALAVLDRPTELVLSDEALRRRLRHEFTWLNRPLVLKARRTLYGCKAIGDVEALTRARLYEQLGRVAELHDETELHDWAVLRCLNLSMILRHRAATGGAASDVIGANALRTRTLTEQLARACAAACTVECISRNHRLCRRYSRLSRYWAGLLGWPPSLTLSAVAKHDPEKRPGVDGEGRLVPVLVASLGWSPLKRTQVACPPSSSTRDRAQPGGTHARVDGGIESGRELSDPLSNEDIEPVLAPEECIMPLPEELDA